MRKIIGLAAVARSGKDTVASILLSNDNVAAYALADPLKAGCQHLFGLTDAQTWDDNCKEVIIPRWGRSPRQLFQEVGTEWMRNHNPEFWLMRADREINGARSTILPDDIPDAAPEAEAIYRACQAFFGFSAEQVLDADLAHTPDPFWGQTPSQMHALIQELTLKSFPDWCVIAYDGNSTRKSRSEFDISRADVIIIKDIRFENEAEYIRNHNGEIWHIIRPNAEKVNAHESEAGIRSKIDDRVIINTGTLEQLREKVAETWKAFKGRP